MPDFLPSELHVKDEDTTNVTIHFFLGGELHCMNRPRDECMAKTLKRLSVTIKKKAGKNKTTGKPKKKTSDAVTTTIPTETDPTDLITVHEHDLLIDVDVVLNESWRTGMSVSVGTEYTFVVVKNAAAVISITVFPKHVLSVGRNAVVPMASTEYADGVMYEWWCVQENEDKTTRLCSEEMVVGCRLKLFCTAWRHGLTKDAPLIKGRSATCYLSGIIQPLGPTAMMLRVREQFNDSFRGDSIPNPTNSETSPCPLRNPSPPHTRPSSGLRVITYNTLAEPFAISDYAVKSMFQYCPLPYLETEYRLPMVLQELLAYQGDVICLQECDAKTFKYYLQPALLAHGYEGHYTNKSSGVMEGCATFTRSNVLEVIRRVDLPLKNVLREAEYLTKGIYAYRPDLQDVLGGKLGTIGQITVCRCIDKNQTHNDTTITSVKDQDKGQDKDKGQGQDKDHTDTVERVVIVANTHLFYHPSAGFARLLQVDAILQAIEGLKGYILEHGCTKEGLNEWMVEGEERGQGLEEQGPGLAPGPGLVQGMTSLSINTSSSSCGVSTSSGTSVGSSNSVSVSASSSGGNGNNRSRNTHVSVIFLGDLNSTPETAAIEYLHTGTINPTHEVWSTVNDFRWGARAGDEEGGVVLADTPPSQILPPEPSQPTEPPQPPGVGELELVTEKGQGVGQGQAVQLSETQTNATSTTAISGGGSRYTRWYEMSTAWRLGELRKGNHPRTSPEYALPCTTPTLTHPFSFISIFEGGNTTLGGQCTEEEQSHGPLPLYTNFTGGFKDLLDWIFIENDQMEVVQIAPFPSFTELSAHTALPSQICPSDHVAVVVDVKFIEKGE